MQLLKYWAEGKMEKVIEVKGLTKRYQDRVVVNNISFEIFKGDIFGFLGPNGSGKTTTILMLLGLIEPDEGEVKVLNLDPIKDSIEIKRKVGYLPENVGFYADLTAKENLEYIGELNNIDRDVLEKKIDEVLEIVGLLDEKDRLVQEFSRGMRQRLGIAEVLIKDPEIIFLDEPTLGLDPEGIKNILDLINRLAKEKNITVLLSSHLLHQVQRICNRIAIMNKGNIVMCGDLNDILKDKQSLEEIYLKYFQE